MHYCDDKEDKTVKSLLCISLNRIAQNICLTIELNCALYLVTPQCAILCMPLHFLQKPLNMGRSMSMFNLIAPDMGNSAIPIPE